MNPRFSKLILRCMCLPLLLAVLLAPMFGGFRPSFGLEYPSWNATNIALVEMTPHDGDFVVLESWKGNLKPSEHINVPQLIPGPHAVPITLYAKQNRPFQPSNDDIEAVPRQPVGSRMVLFLQRGGQGEGTPVAPDSATPEWQPADLFRDIRTSVIWLDGNQLYVFTQWMNPGPSLLSRWDSSLAVVHGKVVEIIATQKLLYAVMSLKDKSERADRLKRYVRSDVLPAKRFALDQLGKCGPSAMETIRPMLDDPDYKLDAEDLIKAYAEAGGESAGEELNNRLQKELAFWETTGPTLQRGWWNQDAKPDAPLRLRYGQTIQLISGLQRTNYRPALTTAVQLRDFWRSYPQLNDPSGLDQLARECNSLATHLQKGE
jgi:hypothetical protein